MNTSKSTQFVEPNYLNYANNRNLVKVVGQKDRDRKLITTSEFRKGEVVYNIVPYLVNQNPDFLSVQIDYEEHILDFLLEAMNHSCSPTTFVDTERMLIFAETDIFPGEELTFFYPSTEWEMNRPFQCNCKSPTCVGLVSGAKSLSISQMVNFQLNNHIKGLIKKSLHL